MPGAGKSIWPPERISGLSLNALPLIWECLSRCVGQRWRNESDWRQKAFDGLTSHLGAGTFDYIGNDPPDLPLLPSMPPRRWSPIQAWDFVWGYNARGIRPARTSFIRSASHPLKSLLKAVRVHQWAKNLLIFVPLLLAHGLTAGKLLARYWLSSASVSPHRQRTLSTTCWTLRRTAIILASACGLLPRAICPPLPGLALSPCFSFWRSPAGDCFPVDFYGWLLLYLATTLTYSLYMKRVVLVDVLALSGLYTLRLLAGSAATHTPISHWLAGFSMFLFLSLAIAKRFAELENLRASNAALKNGRGYLLADLEQMRSFGTASAFAAVVVFAIYISGREVDITLPPAQTAVADNAPHDPVV